MTYTIDIVFNIIISYICIKILVFHGYNRQFR